MSKNNVTLIRRLSFTSTIVSFPLTIFFLYNVIYCFVFGDFFGYLFLAIFAFYGFAVYCAQTITGFVLLNKNKRYLNNLSPDTPSKYVFPYKYLKADCIFKIISSSVFILIIFPFSLMENIALWILPHFFIFVLSIICLLLMKKSNHHSGAYYE